MDSSNCYHSYIYTAFAFGYGSLPYMLQGEILPPYAISIGSGLLGLCWNVSMFIATKVGPTISDVIGMHGSFYIYAGVAIGNLIFAYYTIPETFNLSLEEIGKIYYQNDQRMEKSRNSRKASAASIISFYEIRYPYNK